MEKQTLAIRLERALIDRLRDLSTELKDDMGMDITPQTVAGMLLRKILNKTEGLEVQDVFKEIED